MPERTPPESQPQRTRLAWRRTAASLIVGALISTALVAHRHASPVSMALLVLVLADAAAGLALIERRARDLDRPGFGRLRRSPALLALTVSTIAVLGIALIAVTGD